MNTNGTMETRAILEHIQDDNILEEWTTHVRPKKGERFTIIVLTEEERSPPPAAGKKWEDHPAFGMWADRDDMEDVEQYVREIRKPRYK